MSDINAQIAIFERQQKEKADVIEQLKKMPVVQVACKRAGIGRTTYYQWRRDDKNFEEATNRAMQEGVEVMNDLMESRLLSAGSDKNMSAIQLWLKHHHPKYTNKIELSGNINVKEQPLSKAQEELVQKALRLAGLLPAEEEVKKDE